MCQIERVLCSINGSRSMAVGPYFMHAAVACWLLHSAAAECQYWPCNPPCPKNHRLITNSRCSELGDVGCALDLGMWLQKNGGKPYCEWCDWGEYSDAENIGQVCTHCPRRTVVTQGRYNAKFNDNVGNWCEEDCGVAFQNMMKYPVENQDCEF